MSFNLNALMRYLLGLASQRTGYIPPRFNYNAPDDRMCSLRF
ncbi:hypothetical protein ES703_04897 [subsurface metagenome]